MNRIEICKRIISPILCIMLFYLMGCGNEPTTDVKSIYCLDYNGTVIEINADAESTLSAIGEPDSVFEAPSCAFDGRDILYSYPHMELDVFEFDGNAKIYSVSITDDVISTNEGIFLGDSITKVKEKYGEASVDNGAINYSAKDMKLEFVIRDDSVIAIRYYSTTLEEMAKSTNLGGIHKERIPVTLDPNESQMAEVARSKVTFPRNMAVYLLESLDLTLGEEAPEPPDFFVVNNLLAETDLSLEDLKELKFVKFPSAEELLSEGVYSVSIQAGELVLDTKLYVICDDCEEIESKELVNLSTPQTDGDAVQTQNQPVGNTVQVQEAGTVTSSDISYQIGLLNNVTLNPSMPDSLELRSILDELMPQIINDLDTNEQKVRKCYEYVIYNFRYSQTKKYDYETDAVIFFQTGRGSCTYYVAGLHYMLNYIGIENTIVNGYRYPEPGINRQSFHRWIEIKLGGTSYVLDPQWEDSLSGGGSIAYQRYLLDHNALSDCYAF